MRATLAKREAALAQAQAMLQSADAACSEALTPFQPTQHKLLANQRLAEAQEAKVEAEAQQLASECAALDQQWASQANVLRLLSEQGAKLANASEQLRRVQEEAATSAQKQAALSLERRAAAYQGRRECHEPPAAITTA